ncbi:MAG: ribonuclease E/G [Lachnospiraceae bacterium]|nr:ribonuclease E/G [Lachnospiraceae bacterium]
MSRLKVQSSEKNNAQVLEELRTSEKGRIVITGLKDNKFIFLVSGKRLKSVTLIDTSVIAPGDIVIAIVKDVKKDIGACFIEYAEGCDGYLPLNRIPKDVNVKQGDLIPVSITSQAQKGKRARFTALIDYSVIPGGDALKEKASHLARFNCLYRQEGRISDLIDKNIKSDEFSEIVTDDHDIYELLKTDYENVREYTDTSFPLSKLYSLESGISEALSRQVWLKCGGYLVFDHTEAMTVIDVNSGKYTPSKNTDKESAYLTVNKEAASEICRQLRLRNLSGIIIVDFINLNDKKDQEILLNLLKAESAEDTIPVNIVDITELGLVEITRKKELPSLYEQIKSHNESVVRG